MEVIVAYNIPSTAIPEDSLCHQGVMDEVRDVTGALTELGYTYTAMGIGQNLKQELSVLAHSNADVVFNLCESISGHSSLQPCFAGYLQLLGIPFTGSSALGITIAINKLVTKAVLEKAGICTPQSLSTNELLALMDWPRTSPEALPTASKPLPHYFSLPAIVKPASEDGSIGIDQASIATDWEELRGAVQKAVARFGAANVLAERFIEGREFYAGFLGNTDLVSMPLSEVTFVDLPPGMRPIMSYDAKWVPESIEHRSFRRRCPANLAPHVADRIVAVCETAYKAVGLSGYGRIDVRWDQTNDEIYVLDVNANPDITDGQGFPLTAARGGLAYPQLIDTIITHALECESKPACPLTVSGGCQ